MIVDTKSGKMRIISEPTKDSLTMCSNCLWVGVEEGYGMPLANELDPSLGESGLHKVCPNCKTDEHLQHIERVAD